MKSLKEILNKIFRIKEVDYRNPINKEVDVKYNEDGGCKSISKTETYKNKKGKYTKTFYLKLEPEVGMSLGDYPVYSTHIIEYGTKDFDFTNWIQREIRKIALVQECDEKYIYEISEEQYLEEME